MLAERDNSKHYCTVAPSDKLLCLSEYPCRPQLFLTIHTYHRCILCLKTIYVTCVIIIILNITHADNFLQFTMMILSDITSLLMIYALLDL